MQITAVLARNAREWPNDVALVEINPQELENRHATWREYSLIEPSARYTAEGTRYQFLWKGYFCVDVDTTPDHLVFNEVVGLKDTWGKVKG